MSTTPKTPKKKSAKDAAAKKAYQKRLLKAFEGKEMRFLLDQINNQFDDLRTAEVMSHLSLLKSGQIENEKMLAAVEAVEALDAE